VWSLPVGRSALSVCVCEWLVGLHSCWCYLSALYVSSIDAARVTSTSTTAALVGRSYDSVMMRSKINPPFQRHRRSALLADAFDVVLPSFVHHRRP